MEWPLEYLWHTFGLSMARIYAVPLAYPWRTYGVPLAYPWRTPGVALVYLWPTFGVSMAYRLRIHGSLLAYQWRIPGIPLKRGTVMISLGPDVMLRRTQLFIK